jgi:hypothetical protein
MKLSAAIAAGFAAGLAFAVACRRGGHASAAPNDCAVWQYAILSAAIEDTAPGGTYNAYVQGMTQLNYPFMATNLPTGWEPFAMEGSAVVVRRCKP